MNTFYLHCNSRNGHLLVAIGIAKETMLASEFFSMVPWLGSFPISHPQQASMKA
jgi:hypothetical protein